MSATSQAAPSASAVDTIKEKARRLSILSMMATTAAGSGHPTSCMSAAELMAGIFFYAMKFDPKNPNSTGRRPLRAVEGPCGAGSLRCARGSGRVPGVARDDAAPIFERTRRPSHAANSGRGRRYRLARARGFRLARAWRLARGWTKAPRAFTCCWATAKWPRGKSGKRRNLPATTSSTI